MTKASVLYLVPTNITEIDVNWTIPSNVINQINNIQVFIVENAKTTRHFLKLLNPHINWVEKLIFELDKHQPENQKKEILELLKSGKDIGLMSEAGLPCIADPGHEVVRMAHDNDIVVKPLNGPSSIILALISSGLNGQNFKFNGYLPSKPEERRKSIQILETDSAKTTQLFIEAPYRNDNMLKDLIDVLKPETRLLMAKDITGENELIICRKVSWWKNNRIELGKVPCLFGIGR
ncbi:MAG TPA: SAM-dependent methyltransferase [Bacteroidia bacterium]